MNPLPPAVVTGIGLLLALAGVGCGVAAYIGSVRQYDTLPVWPWASTTIRLLRARLTFKRDARTGSGTGTIVLTGSGIGSAEAFGVGPSSSQMSPQTSGWPRLEARLQLLEERGGAEQARAERAELLLQEQLAKQGRRLEDADEQLRALAKSVAVSSARLQLVGLILVGVGTMLMAVPTIVAAF